MRSTARTMRRRPRLPRPLSGAGGQHIRVFPTEVDWPFPPHSDGEVAASYADGGVMSSSRVAHDPSVTDYATPPHQNGEESVAADSASIGKTLGSTYDLPDRPDLRHPSQRDQAVLRRPLRAHRRGAAR